MSYSSFSSNHRTISISTDSGARQFPSRFFKLTAKKRNTMADFAGTCKQPPKCARCKKKFSDQESLEKHVKLIHQKVECDNCHKQFTTTRALQRHKKQHSGDFSHTCQYCLKGFTRRDKLNDHIKVCQRKEEKQRSVIDRKRKSETLTSSEISEKKKPKFEEGSKGGLIEEGNIKWNYEKCSHIKGQYEFKPCDSKEKDLTLFLKKIKDFSIKAIRRMTVKWNFCIKVHFYKSCSEGSDVQASFCFANKRPSVELLTNNTEEIYEEVTKELLTRIEEYQENGSGWIIDFIEYVHLSLWKYTPLAADGHLPLPKKLRDKKSLLNIENKDNKCFLWSVLASLHPVPTRKHPERVKNYLPHERELNLQGIDFPTPFTQLRKFEQQNALKINVYGFDQDEELFPLYMSEKLSSEEPQVHLLLYTRGDDSHYCVIRNFNAFMSSTSTHRGHGYYCERCFARHTRQDLLNEHYEFCRKHSPQQIIMPTTEKKQDYRTKQFYQDNILHYRNFSAQLKVPFVIYADAETILQKTDESEDFEDELKSSVKKQNEHKICSFGFYTVCINPEHSSSRPQLFFGPDANDQFLKALKKERDRIGNIMRETKAMIISNEESEEFERAEQCHICGKSLGADRVRDHCHITGKYRGAAHQICNINFRFKNFIPVVFHNLKTYDAHLIFQALGKSGEKISVLPNNKERYISFDITFSKDDQEENDGEEDVEQSEASDYDRDLNDSFETTPQSSPNTKKKKGMRLRFIDSLAFYAPGSSLATLINTLKKEPSKLVNTRKVFPDESKFNCLLRKGVYPYNYIDSFERLKETTLPPREAFHDSLSNEECKVEDYQHARRVWETFNMSSLKEYHDLYLTSDIVQLADVFEDFRKLTLEYYQLDAANFVTAPGLAWNAALKKSDVKLELLTDENMHLFFEKGIRGGISTIIHRHAEANNHYCKYYDDTKESSYIIYLDANNLYGWAMSKSLPVEDFKWMTEEEIERFDVQSIPDDGDKGYTLEVDLEYPPHLHQQHNQYPLAPEPLKVTKEIISPFSKNLLENLYDGKLATQEKLVPNLYNKERYVVHYRVLKLYLEYGLVLKKIHRGIAYTQKPWLKDYIDFNTEKRAQASSDSEKSFFKLMNNAVFGKTMENVRQRINVKVATTDKYYRKLVNAVTFKNDHVISPHLVIVEQMKTKIKLEKPIYTGQAILDLSKFRMYRFHYNHMLPKYKEGLQLLFTDTDSLCYHIKTEDIYKDMLSDRDSFYDCSEYPKDHFLFSNENKKKIGYFKDEYADKAPITEFIGLRPKLYALRCDNDHEDKKAKGVKKSCVKTQFEFETYKECLQKCQAKRCQYNDFKSENHRIYTIGVTKIGLSPYDDKRWVHDNGVDTYAYGHRDLHSAIC